MSKRTVKDIEAQIAALEKEKEELQQQVVIDKFKPLLDVLSTTTLSVAQIKKLIKDAENDNGVKKKPIQKKKVVVKVSSKKRKLNIKDKRCQICGKTFTPTSGVQKICLDCKAKGLKPNKDKDGKEEHSLSEWAKIHENENKK